MAPFSGARGVSVLGERVYRSWLTMQKRCAARSRDKGLRRVRAVPRQVMAERVMRPKGGHGVRIVVTGASGDVATRTPIMETGAARTVLGWLPAYGSEHAARELLDAWAEAGPGTTPALRD